MKTSIIQVLALLAFIAFVTSTPGQDVPIPDPGLNAAIREALQKPDGPITEQDLLGLTNLSVCCRQISSVEGLERARNLAGLDLESNSLTNFVVPPSWTNLRTLKLFNNHLTNFVLSSGFQNLTLLDLGFNSLGQCVLPDGLTNLDTLFLEGNALTGIPLPAGLTALTKLDLAANQLTRLALPADMTNLVNVLLFGNQLTNVTFPVDLNRLNRLFLDFNRLGSLALPAGMTNLIRLSLLGNQLTNLTLPPDSISLTELFVDGNPLASFVLSEPMAATNLAGLVASLRDQGVSVSTYPLTAQLVRPRMLVGAFQFGITGPPGVYTVLGSTNLAGWSDLGIATNTLGSITFNDVTAQLSSRKYFRAQLHTPAREQRRMGL